MRINVEIPDELVSQLEPYQDHTPEIIALGLKEWCAARNGEFGGLVRVLEKLAELPAPDEVLSLRPSEDTQATLNHLLEKNRTRGLTEDEEREWRHFELVEHIVRLAKARAALKLKMARAT